MWQCIYNAKSPPADTEEESVHYAPPHNFLSKKQEGGGIFIIHRSITTKENLHWSFWPSESYLAFDSDLRELSELITGSGGNFPDGAISDWKGTIVAAVAIHRETFLTRDV